MQNRENLLQYFSVVLFPSVSVFYKFYLFGCEMKILLLKQKGRYSLAFFLAVTYLKQIKRKIEKICWQESSEYIKIEKGLKFLKKYFKKNLLIRK